MTRGDRILMGRFLAAVDMLGRCGATEFEITAEEDFPELSPIDILWRAEVKFGSVRKFSEFYSYPAQAAEDLLIKVGNGGQCVHCKKTVLIGLVSPGYCTSVLGTIDVDDSQKYRYERGCE